MRAEVSGTPLRWKKKKKKKAFPDSPLLAVQQRERAVLPAAESALISAIAEQISLTEAPRPKQRVCAVLVEQ